MSDVAAIELLGVHKSFHPAGAPSVEAVRGIDLEVQRGELLAFLGPNGAGKTTTLDMILGLTAPTSGVIRIAGRSPRSAVLAGTVSAVLQTGGLLADLTVRETVQMIASTFPRHDPVDAVIDRAGLAALARRRVGACSGGERQRLRFALALLPNPDLLILDEPTAGMDIGARHEFWETMREEVGTGRTVMFATHYLEEADGFAERIVVIAGGRVVADDPTQRFRARAGAAVVSATLEAAQVGPAVAVLREMPGVSEAAAVGDRLTVRATESDAVALALLTQWRGRDLAVAPGSLDDAFLALTAHEAQAEAQAEAQTVPAAGGGAR